MGGAARITIAYCFSDELDEARIHQNRAVGWINWYLHNNDENKRFERSGPEAPDIAAVMFLSVLKNKFSSFNRNIQLWRFKYALSVIEELITLRAAWPSDGQFRKKAKAVSNSGWAAAWVGSTATRAGLTSPVSGSTSSAPVGMTIPSTQR